MAKISWIGCGFFFQLPWGIINKINGKIFKAYIMMTLYMCTLWKESPHLSFLFLLVRSFKSYSLSKFRHTIWCFKTVIIMSYIRSSDLNLTYSWKFVAFHQSLSIYSTLSLPTPGNQFCTFVSMSWPCDRGLQLTCQNWEQPPMTASKRPLHTELQERNSANNLNDLGNGFSDKTPDKNTDLAKTFL